MDKVSRLRQYGKKTISKDDLAERFSAHRIEELFAIVQELQDAGLLVPVKSSGTNGNMLYPLYLKYKITLPKETFEEELAEIAKLHPQLQRGGYLQQKPAEYRKYRAQIQKLDCYLFQTQQERTPISRKERSFEIFSEEKELDSKTFCAFLDKLGLNQETLFFYDTPEYCFNDFIPQRKPEMTLLICENKDIWFNIRRLMFEDGASVLFGVPLDGVVYGCGNKICQAGSLAAYTAFMGGAAVHYYYWGDIDREGLNIYLRLKEVNPSLQIDLFAPAYEEMLRLARGREIPDSADNRERMADYSSVYTAIAPELRDELAHSIAENKRLPQEIISYTSLKKNVKE